MSTGADTQVNNYVINDVRQVAKRNMKLGFIALAFAFFNLGYDILSQDYTAALLVTGLAVALLIVIWLNYRNLVEFGKIFSVVSVNIFLVLINFAQGNKAGAYTYFLPLLFATPFLVNNNKNYLGEVIIYFALTITACLIVIFFSGNESAWETISAERYHEMFLINSTCSLLLTGAFSYLILHTERTYKSALFTAQKNAEAAIEMRTHFISSIAHELRTSLNGISGATHILHKQPFKEEQKPYLDILNYCSQQMFNLVNDILDFDKIESGKVELRPGNYNLKNLLLQCPLPFNEKVEEKNIQLLVETDERLEDVWVKTDDIRLIQVINNLISNAIKFTDSGSVKLKTTIIDESENSITVLIAVLDTGIGIDKENFEKIFHSFWQVYTDNAKKHRGTGLGLSIANNLLQLMNSTLKVESEPGKGSKFSFELKLPKADSDTKNSDIKNTRAEDFTAFEGLNILVADDNPMNMLLIVKMLEEKKINVLKAENGFEVLQHINNHSRIHLVLLDLEMPGMNGYEAMKKIQLSKPHIPVIAFTATIPDEQMYKTLLLQGFKDSIFKPFEPEDLYHKITRFIKVKELQ